jgi:hypothetical protein
MTTLHSPDIVALKASLPKIREMFPNAMEKTAKVSQQQVIKSKA